MDGAATLFAVTASVGVGLAAYRRLRPSSAGRRDGAAAAARATRPNGDDASADGVVRPRADLPPVTHDILLRAARGQRTERVPVWAMRQAGRYLPEFLEVRKRADFFTMCHTPAIAAEVTLQPLRRYHDLLDAVVIFSDILIVPQAMGMEVVMESGRGPVFTRPLDSPEDLGRLRLAPDVRSALAPLFEAITLTRRLAAEEVGKAVPVIGFAGGPWTLMSYMIEGGGSKLFEKSKLWLFRVRRRAHGAAGAGRGAALDAAAPGVNLSSPVPPRVCPLPRVPQHPEASRALLGAITDVVVELLLEQWRAGASILQIFESHAGELSPALFAAFLLPYLRQIAERVRARTPSVAQGACLTRTQLQ
jgi:uroporphyrinogen decarboxylase